MFDDPGEALRKMDRELKAQQPPAEQPLETENFFFPGEVPEENAYYEEDYRRDRKNRRRASRKARGGSGAGMLVLLVILLMIGWWILWTMGKL